MSAVERLKKRTENRRKKLISADGTPYSIWQLRTRFLSFALLVWAVFEIASGAGIIVLDELDVLTVSELVPGITLGTTTVLGGVFNLAVALAGLWGAHDPKKITLFFWTVFIEALLNCWQAASLWSQGQMDPTTLMSVVISLAYAVCAWNVRGQTGYFDNHPHPDEEDTVG